jgi:hypothetical protein
LKSNGWFASRPYFQWEKIDELFENKNVNLIRPTPVLQLVPLENTQLLYVHETKIGILIPVTPHTRCRLKLLKLERIKDYLLMEEEFISNQERLKPQEERNEVSHTSY